VSIRFRKKILWIFRKSRGIGGKLVGIMLLDFSGNALERSRAFETFRFQYLAGDCDVQHPRLEKRLEKPDITRCSAHALERGALPVQNPAVPALFPLPDF
jgi:hypothetical protein